MDWDFGAVTIAKKVEKSSRLYSENKDKISTSSFPKTVKTKKA